MMTDSTEVDPMAFDPAKVVDLLGEARRLAASGSGEKERAAYLVRGQYLMARTRHERAESRGEPR